eukprot:1150046-Pelagomonas_calceolata.AAC.1
MVCGALVEEERPLLKRATWSATACYLFEASLGFLRLVMHQWRRTLCLNACPKVQQDKLGGRVHVLPSCCSSQVPFLLSRDCIVV